MFNDFKFKFIKIYFTYQIVCCTLTWAGYLEDNYPRSVIEDINLDTVRINFKNYYKL